ncbi:ABC transporter permease [Shinella zoogloeoides]|uniref:ABC transporter permease n=1 Tax=Shinella zoogloeoides TaxID=352475 RepID=UPI0028A8896C|nr:ABC transporter permease [Shinella zoogloeoides]
MSSDNQALSTAEAAFEDQRSSVGRTLHRFLHNNFTVVPAAILILSCLLFSLVVGSRFLHPFNFSLILQQATIIGIVGTAQTLIILTAGIDLSVGAIMIMASLIMGRLAVLSGVPVELAFLAGLAAGAACGFANGVLICRFKLPPFITTLGTWSVFGAINIGYSRSETIRSQEIADAAPFLQWTGQSFSFFGATLTYGSILLLLLVAVAWYVLNRTPFGKHVYAIGDDAEAAQLAGINIRRTLTAVYVLAGIICALAGWVLIGRTGSVSSLSGATVNLDSITAVVIGGTSLFGGRGSIIGTLFGALIVCTFRNGIALAGADAVWQEASIGLLILSAVALDNWLRKVSA